MAGVVGTGPGPPPGRRGFVHGHRLFTVRQAHRRRQVAAVDRRLEAQDQLAAQVLFGRCFARVRAQTPARIDKDADRDNYMSAHEAAEYGIVDRVLLARRQG